jgi:hypothetical protein
MRLALSSGCEPFRQETLAKVEQGLSAVRIHQDLVEDHRDGTPSYYSVRRFVARLLRKMPLLFRRMRTEPSEKSRPTLQAKTSPCPRNGLRICVESELSPGPRRGRPFVRIFRKFAGATSPPAETEESRQLRASAVDSAGRCRKGAAGEGWSVWNPKSTQASRKSRHLRHATQDRYKAPS